MLDPHQTVVPAPYLILKMPFNEKNATVLELICSNDNFTF